MYTNPRCSLTLYSRRKCTGFFALGIMGYAAIAVSIVVLGLMLALKVQTSRLESAQETIAAIKIQGELEESRRTKEKERSDADYKSRIARLERDGKRLRDSASSSVLPASAIAPGACISGAGTDRSLREFIAEVTEVIVGCGAAVEALDSAKRWAQDGR